VDVPQILWHDNSARIMSLDFYPNSNYLITGSVYSGEDNGIRFWELKWEPSESSEAGGSWVPEYKYDL